MNTSHILNSSSSYMAGYLSSIANANPNLNVSQSLVFYDKSRHESEILDIKKEVIYTEIFIIFSRSEERKLNLKNKRL